MFSDWNRLIFYNVPAIRMGPPPLRLLMRLEDAWQGDDDGGIAFHPQHGIRLKIETLLGVQRYRR